MNIAWIGTGIMGAPMCTHLMEAGHETIVFNRSPDKMQCLREHGARVATSPAHAAAHAEVVFSIVGYPEDVENVYFGENGILSTVRSGSVLIDMTTSSPDLAVQIARKTREKGAFALDAPVSGGDVGAREARLSIMVGGDDTAYTRVKPLLDTLGRTVLLMGGPGSGQHTKMANQIAIAGTMIGVVESLLYAREAGLNLDRLIDIIGQGAAGSWSLNNLGRRIAAGDFNPGFMIMHFIKDMGIALAEGKRMNLKLPGLALVESFYQVAVDKGLERSGTQALYTILDNLITP